MSGSKEESSEIPSVVVGLKSQDLYPNGLDHSSVHFTIHKLNGKNFLEWAQSIKLVIDGKGRLGYLTGETKEPEKNDTKWNSWKSENSMVIAWLVNSMEPSIGKTYLFLPTARDVWDAVRETYSDLENSSQIFELKTRLWNSKQGERNVIDYYNEMRALWQELDLCYEESWECKNDSIKYQKRMENDRVYVFLAGLNRELDDVRGRILGKKPLPSLSEVFAEVRREEGRRRVMLSVKPVPAIEVSALVSKNTSNQQPRQWLRGDRIKCEHCHKPYHTQETCWELHGKPPNWKPKFSKQKGREFRANQTEAGEETGAASGTPSFSKEQLDQLYKFFQSTQLSKPTSASSSSSLAQQGFKLGDDD
ncbi:uncharacterized protein [Henckelia pumila]|uniref:uncharacterized protein n=1 Tax=Henckelia pumila TaxID=405737 RepID=UPI003C6E18DA